MQRPTTGLLANLLEFPSFEIAEKSESEITKKFVSSILLENFCIDSSELKDLGEIIHQVK
jgi:adenine-specific DNA glycosylase